MAVGKGQSGQPAGNQRSISHFFTQKSGKPALLSSTPKKSPPEQKSTSNGTKSRPVLSAEDPTHHDADSDDSEDVAHPTQRSSLKRNLDAFRHDATLTSKTIASHPKRVRRSDSSFEVDASEPADEEEAPSSPQEISSSTLNGSSMCNIATRTSRYLFSQTQTEPQDEETLDPELLKKKERLRQKFVKKLGRPDSIAEIKRRNHLIDAAEGGAIGDEDGDDQDEDDEEDGAGRQTSKASGKKGSAKLTPMEKQVLEIKKEHPDTLLVVEVGYKFRFFGEDARTAAKELSIVCIPGKMRYDEHPSEAHLNRFASASIPVHRLHVHVKRLVQAGHKVGVVRQLETAALKAVGDNRNTPFVRKLTNLYTKGTYIDDKGGLLDDGGLSASKTASTGYLLCITETKSHGWGTDEKVNVGILAVQPQTGDILHDSFEDSFLRSEIDTRLLHISPCEMLLVGALSRQTEKVVSAISTSSNNALGDKVRIERVERPKTMTAEAHSHVASFYAGRLERSEEEEKDASSDLLEKALKLPDQVMVCLSAMIKHLTAYGMEHVFDLTKYFSAFSTRAHMLLNGNTLASLEIYRNNTDNTERGSLFWILDRTKTRFGQRMLRKWVGRPLLDLKRLQERVDAVDELRSAGKAVMVEKISQLLNKTKIDLEKSLLRIYYGNATRPELVKGLQALRTIGQEFLHHTSTFNSPLVQSALQSLPTIALAVTGALDRINLQAALEDNKQDFFMPQYETAEIAAQKAGITAVEQDLKDQKAEIAVKLKMNKVEYVSVAGIDYLVEVPNGASLKLAPASWAKISGTKKVSRFHTPAVIGLIKQRDQHRESLAAACDDAYRDFLATLSEHYQELRDAVQSLATLDCLLSLVDVANQPGYVRPEYAEKPCLDIIGGRHPMVEAILTTSGSTLSYIPNDSHLSTDGTRALLITGPNMGGKSSYVRHLALLAVMAQIGSCVPATSAKVGIFDAIFTRMGAADNMMKGESTFQVELGEMSTILRAATPRSLVLVDELGRGTSTHDGVAVAEAVLVELVERGCLTGFITHYQSLAKVADMMTPQGALKNVHVKFEASGPVEMQQPDGRSRMIESPEASSEMVTGQLEDRSKLGQMPEGSAEENITLLYEIGEGVAHRSYGLNVARIAGLSDRVLREARQKSGEMEVEGRRRRLQAVLRSLNETSPDVSENSLRRLVVAVAGL